MSTSQLSGRQEHEAELLLVLFREGFIDDIDIYALSNIVDEVVVDAVYRELKD